MSGIDVARRIQRTRPSLPMLFITGFADRTALAGVAEQHIISKPFRRDELAQKIRDALAEAGAENVVRLRR
jgi:CheY-like chemotaxis protein